MSQIPRYLYGSTNVSLLQSQRSSAITPAEGAAAAAAPYKAVSDAAKNISADLAAVQEYKDKVQDKEDTMASALNMSNYKNTTEANKKQAIAENWSPELFEANQGAIDKAFMGSAELISERNRPLITRTYQSAMSGIQLETAITSSEIKRNIQGQDYQAQRAQSVQNKTYETTMFLDDMARQSGLIEEAEYIKLSALTEGQKTAEGWMNKYKDAVATGTEDDLLLKMSEADLTDETWAFFGQDKTQYDAATQAIANDIRIARQIDYNNFFDTIGPGTSPDAVDAYINENKHLTDGQINSMRGRIRQVESNVEFMSAMFANNTSAKRRDILNEAVPVKNPDGTERQPDAVLADLIAVTEQIGTSPSRLTDMANNYSDSVGVGQLTTIGDALIAYYDNPATAGVPLPMTDKTRARTTMYADLVRRQVPKVDAEATVNEMTLNLTNDEIQARKRAWVNESGRLDVDSEDVMKKITERLSDPDDPVGQQFVAEFGVGFWNLIDNYGDANVKISPLMEIELEKNAEMMFLATSSTEVATNASLNSIRARGAAGTDINYDVSVTSKQASNEEGNGYEIQINPITRSAANGDILPREQVRSEIGQALVGSTFRAFGSPNLEGREYTIDELEIGDGVVATYGPNKGNLQWPLKYMGGGLVNTTGPEKDQPVYFYWENAPAKAEIEVPARKEAATIVNDRLDYSDTGTGGF